GDASRQCRHSRAPVRDRCAHTGYCSPCTSATVARSTSVGDAVARCDGVVARFSSAVMLLSVASDARLVFTRLHSKLPSLSQCFWLVAATLCYGVRTFRVFAYTLPSKHACTGSRAVIARAGVREIRAGGNNAHLRVQRPFAL